MDLQPLLEMEGAPELSSPKAGLGGVALRTERAIGIGTHPIHPKTLDLSSVGEPYPGLSPYMGDWYRS